MTRSFLWGCNATLAGFNLPVKDCHLQNQHVRAGCPDWCTQRGHGYAALFRQRTLRMANLLAVRDDMATIERDLCSYRRNARIRRTEMAVITVLRSPFTSQRSQQRPALCRGITCHLIHQPGTGRRLGSVFGEGSLSLPLSLSIRRGQCGHSPMRREAFRRRGALRDGDRQLEQDAPASLTGRVLP